MCKFKGMSNENIFTLDLMSHQVNLNVSYKLVPFYLESFFSCNMELVQ